MRFNTSVGESLEIRAPSESAGARLDRFLAGALEAPSRTYAKRLIDLDLVRVDGEATKPAYRLKGGERIGVFVPEVVAMSAEPEAIPLDVLHEDEHVIVVNKPAGLVVHPSPGHERGTLVNALLHHCGDLSGIGGVLRPGIVHRLDRDTTGCLVCAKSDPAHRELAAQFAGRTVEKTYIALTRGVPEPPEGVVEGRIGRHPHPKHRQMQAMLDRGGRHSRTRYRVQQTLAGAFALVECDLDTGRTHQIRVHMKHLGTPILCDDTYGRGGRDLPPAVGAAIERQALHAHRLAFDHPLSGTRLTVEAPVPADIRRAISALCDSKE